MAAPQSRRGPALWQIESARVKVGLRSNLYKDARIYMGSAIIKFWSCVASRRLAEFLNIYCLKVKITCLRDWKSALPARDECLRGRRRPVAGDLRAWAPARRVLNTKPGCCAPIPTGQPAHLGTRIGSPPAACHSRSGVFHALHYIHLWREVSDRRTTIPRGFRYFLTISRQAKCCSPQRVAKVSDTSNQLPSLPTPWFAPMQEHWHSWPVALRQAGAHFSCSR